MDTAPVAKRPPPPPIPVDDRPEDMTGEITTPIAREVLEVPAEPSILVADLAAAHVAAAQVATAAAATTATGQLANAATPAREAAVDQIERDAAAAFTDAEEAFFQAGHEKEKGVGRGIAMDSFDDLDEGYEPVGFWDKLLGRKKPKSKK